MEITICEFLRFCRTFDGSEAKADVVVVEGKRVPSGSNSSIVWPPKCRTEEVNYTSRKFVTKSLTPLLQLLEFLLELFGEQLDIVFPGWL